MIVVMPIAVIVVVPIAMVVVMPVTIAIAIAIAVPVPVIPVAVMGLVRHYCRMGRAGCAGRCHGSHTSKSQRAECHDARDGNGTGKNLSHIAPSKEDKASVPCWVLP